MIPKIIHYCWLSGDPYPPLIELCISSWKKHLIDYEIILWDTNKIDINSNDWLKEAYENKKYAFAADYIRFYALYHYGGIYLDSDVEVLKSFNQLLDADYIIGEEAGGDIEAAVIGAVPKSDWIKECLDYYTNRHFINSQNKFDLRPVPLLVNEIALTHNLNIYPYTYFSPKDYNICNINITSETYCIHHFDGKWVNKNIISKIKRSIHHLIYFLCGRKMHNKLIHNIRPFIKH